MTNGRRPAPGEIPTFTLCFLTVLAAGIAVRFYALDQFPPGLYYDEYCYALDAWHSWKTGIFQVFYPANNGREGLFMWLLAAAYSVFGDSIETIRGTSAFFACLTLILVYLLTKELFLHHPRRHVIALVAMLLVAFSFWHLNFSRFVFRAGLVPFFETLGLWLLLRAARTKEMLDFIVAAAVIGLGLYTYPAYWVFPAFAAWVLWQSDPVFGKAQWARLTAMAVAFLLIAAPLLLYISEHPQTFFYHVQEVSINKAKHQYIQPSLILRFLDHCRDIITMLFLRGDINLRHNYQRWPELGPLAMAGVATVWAVYAAHIIRKERFVLFRIWLGRPPETEFALRYGKPLAILTLWAIMAALPAIFAMNANHALRNIGMVVPIHIMAALGLFMLWEMANTRFPRKKLLSAVAVVALAAQMLWTTYVYFFLWGKSPATHHAFTAWVNEKGNVEYPGFVTTSRLNELLVKP